jgi:hypothetical protein
MIGEKLVGKLWDTVTKEGIGSLASPWQTRRQGRASVDARRDELLLLAQTEVDVADIKAGKKKYSEDRKLKNLVQSDAGTPLVESNQGRIEPYFEFEDIEEISNARVQAKNIQEQINLTKTVLYAEEEIENFNEEGSDEDINPDWFVRWRDCAEKVSSEELQRLWAKALAGEIASPGSYSLRTLEFIKNISQAEAHEISKLAPYVMNSGSVYKVNCIEEAGINFNFLLEMEDLGVLSGVKGGGLNLSLASRKGESFEHALFYNNQVLLIKHDDVTKKAEFPCYKVTNLGREVLGLGVFPMNNKYLEQIGHEAKKQGFEVVLADWVQTSKEHGRYYNSTSL